LEITGPNGDADLIVYDANGGRLGASAKPGKKIDHVAFSTSTGKAYVRVDAYGNSATEVRFRLIVEPYDLFSVAKDVLDGAAALIVASAYPTADYRSFEILDVSSVAQGVKITARFHFYSGWTGDPLFFDLAIVVDDDLNITDVQPGRYSGYWAPFTAAGALGELIDALEQ